MFIRIGRRIALALALRGFASILEPPNGRVLLAPRRRSLRRAASALADAASRGAMHVTLAGAIYDAAAGPIRRDLDVAVGEFRRPRRARPLRRVLWAAALTGAIAAAVGPLPGRHAAARRTEPVASG